MLSIGIEPADNGVIKTLVDDNINGGGEDFEARQVYVGWGAQYISTSDSEIKNKIQILEKEIKRLGSMLK